MFDKFKHTSSHFKFEIQVILNIKLENNKSCDKRFKSHLIAIEKNWVIEP